jgi:hypothetical protein
MGNIELRDVGYFWDAVGRIPQQAHCKAFALPAHHDQESRSLRNMPHRGKFGRAIMITPEISDFIETLAMMDATVANRI